MSRSRSSDPGRVPMRRCMGCMQSKPKAELVRIAYYEGKLCVDTQGRAKGRGVYLCRDPECIENARKKRGLNRSFRTNFSQEESDRIFRELTDVE